MSRHLPRYARRRARRLRLPSHRPGACRDDAVDPQDDIYFSTIYFGCTTVIVVGNALPTPRNCGRYMSSTSGGGTV